MNELIILAAAMLATGCVAGVLAGLFGIGGGIVIVPVLEAACAESGLNLELRRHDGYDHGYYFISTFIEDHLRFHAEQLSK